MKFATNKEKGNTGLGIAIAYYSSNGYTVSIPLNDTQDYDLIIDKNNNIKSGRYVWPDFYVIILFVKYKLLQESYS